MSLGFLRLSVVEATGIPYHYCGHKSLVITFGRNTSICPLVPDRNGHADLSMDFEKKVNKENQNMSVEFSVQWTFLCYTKIIGTYSCDLRHLLHTGDLEIHLQSSQGALTGKITLSISYEVEHPPSSSSSPSNGPVISTTPETFIPLESIGDLTNIDFEKAPHLKGFLDSTEHECHNVGNNISQTMGLLGSYDNAEPTGILESYDNSKPTGILESYDNSKPMGLLESYDPQTQGQLPPPVELFTSSDIRHA
eukprot:TRINITY_DN2842_c0_g1_i5.p1 TRINITY_DN2842_c0_g1~~TRINITY_DN2842_c0_g1_i5.p1  ORF type:complete len:251 (-),score=37.26 TRINITY_DN2842_c0_g1_i5:262-1014(-)